MNNNAVRALEMLEREIREARATLDKLFEAWDQGALPSPKTLSGWNKKQLLSLIEELQGGMRRAPPPKKEECARILLTSCACQHLPWNDLATLIREAFTKRGLKCNMSLRSLQWYPSSKGFMALPRLKIGLDFLLENDNE